MDPKYLEPLGLRALYVLTVRIFGGTPLPRPGGSCRLTTGDLEKSIETGVLYRNLNLCRALLYTPQGWACWVKGVTWGLWVIGAWALIHILLALAECYRIPLAKALLPHAETGPAQKPEPIGQATPPGWFFRPWPMESVGLYKALGLDQYGAFVIWVMTSVGTKRPDFLDAPDRKSLAQFEMSTRASEVVHLVLFAAMAAATVAAFRAGIVGPAVWSCVMAWGDLNLALLQRYHRVRAWPLLKRARERAR